MQVGPAIGGPPAHAGPRAAHPPAPSPAGGRLATAAEGTAPDDAPAGTDAPARTRPGGPDTPWTHALHHGNGAKVGIHRRFAEEIAAQQMAAGLAPAPGPDAESAPDAATPPLAEDVSPAPDDQPAPIDQQPPAPDGPEAPDGDPGADGSTGIEVVGGSPNDTDLIADLLDALDDGAEPADPAPADHDGAGG